jgi:hypothetical protein
LPTGPAYASAAEPAPAPPVKPQAVAALEQPDSAADASTDQPRSAGAKLLAPLPPRRPADLDAAVALAAAPMPPVRPADLILASATDQPGGAFVTPSNKDFGAAGAIAQHGSLPQVITAGVDRAPTGALALAEGLSLAKYDDSELLARAAELTAPLPPMPIPNVGATAATPVAAIVDKTAGADKTAAPQAQHGWVVRTAALAAEDLAQWFGGVFRRGAPAAPNPNDLRGEQP